MGGARHKHIRAVVQSTGVSTEEENFDDSKEVEGEDLPCSDRSSEDEEEEEENEDAKGEGEGDEDEESEEEDDDVEDEGDSDDSEGNDDDEGGDGGEGVVSKIGLRSRWVIEADTHKGGLYK